MNRRWTQPERVPFSGRDFNCLPDGRTLLFASNRAPEEGIPPLTHTDIWVVERAGADWSEPVNPGPSINTDVSAAMA